MTLIQIVTPWWYTVTYYYAMTHTVTHNDNKTHARSLWFSWAHNFLADKTLADWQWTAKSAKVLCYTVYKLYLSVITSVSIGEWAEMWRLYLILKSELYPHDQHSNWSTSSNVYLLVPHVDVQCWHNHYDVFITKYSIWSTLCSPGCIL